MTTTRAALPTLNDLQKLQKEILDAGKNSRWFVDTLQELGLPLTETKNAEGAPAINYPDEAFTWKIYDQVRGRLRGTNEGVVATARDTYDRLQSMAADCGLAKDWVYDRLTVHGAIFNPAPFVLTDDAELDHMMIPNEAVALVTEELEKVCESLAKIKDRRETVKRKGEQAQKELFGDLLDAPEVPFDEVSPASQSAGEASGSGGGYETPPAVTPPAAVPEGISERLKAGQCENPECAGTLTPGSCKCARRANTEHTYIECESDDCILPATMLLGSGDKTTYRCDACASRNEFKKLRRRVSLADLEKEKAEKASQKEEAARQKLREQEFLVTRAEQLLVANRWTGEAKPLGEVARQLSQLKAEIEAIEATLTAEKRRLTALYDSIKDTYGPSILLALQEYCPQGEDGEYKRKYLLTRHCRIQGRKSGGVKIADQFGLDQFIHALQEDELDFFGITLRRAYDLDHLKTLMDGGIEIEGLVKEPASEIGSWDISIPE